MSGPVPENPSPEGGRPSPGRLGYDPIPRGRRADPDRDRPQERISNMTTASVRRLTSTIPAIALLFLVAAPGEVRSAELLVGGATISITPDRPIALAGQMHTRIAKDVRSPVTATALAFESKG